MKHLDFSFASPEENLACDEALIDQCEGNDDEGVLRFWESDNHFVVVGYSNRIQDEVNVDGCRKGNIPILRRCSGGGTVLQGPGCLNYSLVLRITDCSDLQTVTGTNTFVMTKHRDVFSTLLGQPVEAKGHTDLTVDGLKFSGNAQRRKRTSLLFHGTFLLEFDLSLMERFLCFPSKQPTYRNSRPHQGFLRNLNIPPNSVKNALKEAWNAQRPMNRVPTERIVKLMREKYTLESWVSRT